MTAQASPITDVRGGADYRQAMLLVLGRRALAAARSRPVASQPDGAR
jgi:CO/xanthine dehydrogenase FAD-binding subunit